MAVPKTSSAMTSFRTTTRAAPHLYRQNGAYYHNDCIIETATLKRKVNYYS